MKTVHEVTLGKLSLTRKILCIGAVLYLVTLAFFFLVPSHACAQGTTPFPSFQSDAKKADKKPDKKAKSAARPPLVIPGADIARAWKIVSVTEPDNPKQHAACEATPTHTGAPPIKFLLDVKGAWSVLVEGVSFGVPLTTSTEGYFQIDQSKVYQAWVKSVRPPNDIMFYLGDPSADQLQELSKAKTLVLSVNGHRYDVDLAGTRTLAAQLQQCNADGQSEINARIMKEAVPIKP